MWVLIVSAGAIAALTGVPAAHGASGTVNVTDGTIRWGVLSSFRSYVTGPIAHGAVTVSAPATDNGKQTTFAEATGTWGDTETDVTAQGAVRFTGHGGTLDLTLSHPTIRVQSNRAQLLVDAVDSEGTKRRAVPIADLDISAAVATQGRTVTITNAAATLTSTGTTLFTLNGASFYSAGKALDPVSASWQLSDTPTNPTPGPIPSAVPTHGTSPAPNPNPGKPDSSKAPAGYLAWGIKASFRSYVTGPIAQGSIALSSGAGSAKDGFRFGQASTSAHPPNAQGTTAYRGAVRFSGHHGTLNLTFAAPTITVTSATKATLRATVSGFGTIDLASLNLAGRAARTTGKTVAFTDVPATLTAAGARVFSYSGSSFYPAGTALDPVSFRIGSTASSSWSATSAGRYAAAPAASNPAASAKPVAAPESGCPVSDATLTWGVKESFRAYISGSIANGDWSTTGPVSYKTPAFTWRGGTGKHDPNTGAVTLSFSGTATFTGHHGSLNTSMGNPRVRMSGTAGALDLDFASTSMEDAMAGKAKRTTVPGLSFLNLVVDPASVTRNGDQVTVTSVPGTLTGPGSQAFTNYSAGTAFDPVTVSYRIQPGCQSPNPDAPTASTAATQSPGSGPWLVGVGSGVAGALLGSAATLFVLRRRLS